MGVVGEAEVVAAVDKTTLHLLNAAALALPGMSGHVCAALPVAKPEVDFQYARYQESSDRISVDVYQGSAKLALGRSVQAAANWVVDTFSGATPVLTMPESAALVVSGASGFNAVNSHALVSEDSAPVQVMSSASIRETRYGVGIGGSYFAENLSFHLSGERSEEPDYLAHAYQMRVDAEFNRKLTMLSLSLGQSFDRIEPSTRTLQENKSTHKLQLEISQVLDMNSVLQLNFSYAFDTGYLSNPYKKVYINKLSPGAGLESGGFDQVYYENRPSSRHAGALALNYRHYFATWDSALHLDYRYYRDSWGIDSHTFEASWHQPLGTWMLVPSLRYYTQSKARFYQLFFVQPNASNHYSSDFRLAGFGSVGSGVRISKELLKKTGPIASLKFQAGFDFTFHAADLKLGRRQGSEITDFNYYLVTASLNLQF